MNARVSVLFELSTRVAKGLADGSMIRRGGVIQWATGDAKGEVVTWLRESAALQEHLRDGVALQQTASSQLAQLGIGMNVVLGMQVLTLASVAVGFAVINNKLRVIDRKLDAILNELSVLHEDVTWLDRRQDLAMMARLTSALETSAWAEEAGRQDALPSARAALLESEHHLAGLLSIMTQTSRAHRYPDAFAAYHGALALAGVGRARVDGLLEGVDAEAQTLTAVEYGLSVARGALQRSMRDFDANARMLLQLPRGAKAVLPQCISDMKETEHRVTGYRTELAFCAAEGFSRKQWREFGNDESRPLLLFIEPRPAA